MSIKWKVGGGKEGARGRHRKEQRSFWRLRWDMSLLSVAQSLLAAFTHACCPLLSVGAHRRHTPSLTFCVPTLTDSTHTHTHTHTHTQTHTHTHTHTQHTYYTLLHNLWHFKHTCNGKPTCFCRDLISWRRTKALCSHKTSPPLLSSPLLSSGFLSSEPGVERWEDWFDSSRCWDGRIHPLWPVAGPHKDIQVRNTHTHTHTHVLSGALMSCSQGPRCFETWEDQRVGDALLFKSCNISCSVLSDVSDASDTEVWLVKRNEILTLSCEVMKWDFRLGEIHSWPLTTMTEMIWPLSGDGLSLVHWLTDVFQDDDSGRVHPVVCGHGGLHLHSGPQQHQPGVLHSWSPGVGFTEPVTVHLPCVCESTLLPFYTVWITEWSSK